MTTIAVIVGSLRKASINRKLAKALVRLAPADVVFDWVEIGDLPLYNQDDDEAQAASVQRVKAQIAHADGLLIVTPEHNRTIPAALKNVLDHGSRPYGKNVWAGKAAGVLGTSPGGIGTALAQQHLRGVLAALGVRVLPQPDAYLQYREGMVTEDGEIGEASREFLQKWLNGALAWVTKGL
ncbi:NADPH-dependent FMN reductase [Corticibacter populi]|nr:chromate reductase [Corticibacter populi]